MPFNDLTPYENNSMIPFIEEIPINDLILYENNPRRISKDQFEKLKDSISKDRDFFYCRPCLVSVTPNGDLLVYAGNQRLRAAQSLGWTHVPCIVNDELTEVQIKTRVIKDNKCFGTFDDDMLANEYDPDMLIECGFTMTELDIFPEEKPLDCDKLNEENVSKCLYCGKVS